MLPLLLISSTALVSVTFRPHNRRVRTTLNSAPSAAPMDTLPLTLNHQFHHLEFYTDSARKKADWIARILGADVVDHDNGEGVALVISNDLRMLFIDGGVCDGALGERADKIVEECGDLVVATVCIQVDDVDEAYKYAVGKGATSVTEPVFFNGEGGKFSHLPWSMCNVAEISLYGKVVLRFISADCTPSVTTTPKDVTKSKPKISRIDHVVGNLPSSEYKTTIDRLKSHLSYGEFAEFTAEDVGTDLSGLNSVVLSSETGAVLLPLNEPVNGKKLSQIQTFLDRNNDRAGVQHTALITEDIFGVVERMRGLEGLGCEPVEGLEAGVRGCFELMDRPNESYYDDLPQRLSGRLTAEQMDRCRELGILADADPDGVLLQIFTKPLPDRPTFFFEIIQRVGCEGRPGCGGFGKGNFRALFKAIEDYEERLEA